MTAAEKKDLMALLSKAMKDPVSLFFRVAGKSSEAILRSQSVDPIALGIPHYFEM